jgi:hypothetical protein
MQFGASDPPECFTDLGQPLVQLVDDESLVTVEIPDPQALS